MNLRAANTSSGAVTVNNSILNVTGSGQLFSNFTNSFANAVSIQNSGELQIDNWNWGGSMGTLYFDASAFVLNGGTLTYQGTTANGTANRGFTVGTNGATFNSASTGQTWVLARASGYPTYLASFNGSSTLTGVGNGQMDQFISGSGGLTKNGSGKWTLTGVNSYNGGTTISDGTLQIGNGGTDGTLGSGNVTNNAQLAFNRADAAIVSNRITGNGRVDHSGSGTLVMTGNNDYTGQTVVGVGVLQVGSGGSAGSIGTGDVYINDNGVLRYNRSDLVFVTNRITYGGGFQQSGTGTTVLLGNNDFYGGTTVYSGTLQVGNGGTNGTMGTGAVVNNSRIALNRADTATVANLISGTGNLEQSGNGRSILSANNTFSGGTLISAGVLQVGSGGASGALGGGNITNNAQLLFDRSDTATFSNRITGNGRVDHSGSGTLVLTGNNDYSGQTVVGVGLLQVGSGGSVGSIGTGDVYINDNGVLRYNRSDLVNVTNRITYGGGFQQAGTGTTVLLGNNDFYGGTTVSVGTLQVGNGGTNGTMGSGAVVNNSMIVVDKAGTFNLANTISGTGSLTVAGSGTTVLSASNSYSGLTKASGGTLEVNGSIAGGLQVDAGATLKGSGSIGGATTISGTHSVGNSPGLQSFGSSLSYQSNSMVHLEFTLNSTTGRGVSFDAINVAGDLSFAPGAGISLTFNSAGSSVNWNDILWNDYIKTSDGWLLYQVGGNLSGLDNVTLSGSLLDSNGLALSSASQDSAFNLYQVGNNVYLNYSIPEPSTYALMGLGALALVIAVRRRRV